MKYFTGCKTLDELKKEYRRLAMVHHPDMGGDTATMQAINNEYASLFEVLKRQHNERAAADETGKTYATTEAPEEFMEIVEKLLRMSGLEVELCGSWLWIGGNTREHKDDLKAAGCRWSSNKKLWYWHHAEEGHKWHKGTKNMDQIRSKYGSQTFRSGSAHRLEEATA